MSEQLHILIVDDNPTMASTLADILAIKGFDVYEVQSGVEALKVLEDHPIDILLTDVKMSGMSGVELYREARKTHPNLYTIFMTAYAADDLINKGLDLGVKTVLTKPLNIDLVLIMFESIHKTIHLSQARAADAEQKDLPGSTKG
jgi:CheY-like chemotaxis protein